MQREAFEGLHATAELIAHDKAKSLARIRLRVVADIQYSHLI